MLTGVGRLDFRWAVGLDLPFVHTYQQQALQALGDPTRREIFERLTAGPLAVGELAQELPISRPAVSQHLKVLKEARLVFDRPSGTRRVYQVDPAAVAALREYFDSFWSNALASFRAAAEEQEQPPEPRREA
jgi:DNA-binding transcriptional ArsR family regulator